MNENVLVKVYEFDNPLIQKVDSLIDISVRDCHIRYFLAFDKIYEYDFQFTNIGKNQMIHLTISDKNMSLYELNKKLTISRGNGLIFNQINIF